MPAMQPLCLLLEINPSHFSKVELIFLESSLFFHVCEALKKIIREKNSEYFQLITCSLAKENIMLEKNFICYIVNDILSTNEYTLPGIALYTDVPEDAIFELANGSNSNPSFLLSRKIMELHFTVRPAIYREIANRIKKKLFLTSNF